jgi:5-methylcytosine-specific restriction endonuclease McrA
MQNHVFVLDTNKRSLSPIHPGEARCLLSAKKAAVYRRFPFTIILFEEVVETIDANVELKIDPGSKTTGIALVRNNKVIWAAELEHRGQAIKADLEARRSLRRARRNRKTRYRKPRFNNRTKPKGWLPPSLMHRVLTIRTWVQKLCKFAPIGRITQELVRFDLQELENPEISGLEYQQGELQGYEVREYLLEKFGRKCVYCDAEHVPLEIEHVVPKSAGGSNRISNLTLACHDCNQKKGSRKLEEFLADKPAVLARVRAQLKAPLKDATAVNATRWRLFEVLKDTELLVSTGSGGQTKYNRTRFSFPKAHWIDAACVGQVSTLELKTKQPLLIRATGHGTRQMCGTDKYGFPKRHRSGQSSHFSFQTGDIIKAIVTKGKKTGTYLGRVLCRATGSFDIVTKRGRISGVSYRCCKAIHRKDGYSYGF